MTANAVFNLYGTGPIRPVNNVIKTKEYREQEKEKQGQGFSEMLARECAKKKELTKKRESKQENLRYMAGLNQYDRRAREFCFILSSKADYKA